MYGMKACKNCKRDFEFEGYGSGEFCCEHCARSYARKQSSIGTKIVKCITCKKEIEVDKRASDKQCKCEACRKYKKQNYNKIKKDVIIYFCKNCNQKLSTKRSFCNDECFQEYRYNAYIENWKVGKVDGSKCSKTAISGYVRRYLWKKYNGKCSRCGWDTPNPITKKPVLEIEHIDGNSENNKEENLDLICPNCHSLTLTYKALNYGKGNRKRLKYHKLI
jgi:hypothetical protein